MVGSSNNGNNFPQKWLLVYTQILRPCKAFGNGSLANIEFSKTQMSEIIQPRRFIELVDRIFEPATRVALEISGILNSIDKGKSAPKGLLDAEYNLVNKKIDIKDS